MGGSFRASPALTSICRFATMGTGDVDDSGHGRIGRTMAGSEPWWPPHPTPPVGAPNVIVVLVDDVGFADIGCYGGEIRTPNIDRLAAEGVRFANFHVNPMCSPTRASLLTGVNAHAAGMGHVAQDDPGYPGYRGELADNVATAAEILRDHGYATLMVGKWHLCRDSDMSAYGPMHSWPCQRGFQRYYGNLEAFTNLHHPHALFADNHQVDVERYPDGYHLTDDLTDQAITMIRERKASRPSQPFFLYVAHPAAHAPLMAMPADIARYDDVYSIGWDVIRERRHARQIEMGIIPPGTPLPPRNSEPANEVEAWSTLSTDQQQLYARYMAVFAAMIDRVDQNLGRLRSTLEEMGEWDDTIVVFLSDNGASREGEATGTTNYYGHLAPQVGAASSDLSDDLARYDDIGSPRTMTHYPRGWAMAGNTPFRLYKRNTHAGGHQVPCIWSWPAGLSESEHGSVRTHYGHCVDVLPTVLDLIGVSAPDLRHGSPVRPMNGTSLAAILRDARATEVRYEQYYEMEGNRGLYRDGHEIVTLHQARTPFGDDEWELYDLRNDPVELQNLAVTNPSLLAELAARWDEVAHENQVYPLDEGSGWRYIVRPMKDDEFGDPVTIWRGTPTLDRWRSNRLLTQRNTRVVIDCAWAPGDRGVLLAHGDQGGGYCVYVDDGRVHVAYNDGHGHLSTLDGGPMSPGDQRVTIDFEAPGGRRWNIVVRVDDEPRGRLDDLTMLFPMAPFEGIDVGIDRRSPVVWDIYEREGPFPYSGAVRWARYEPGEPAPDAPIRWVDFVRQMGAKFE